MIQRHISNNKIKSLLQPNKVLVLYGPRRVGKTTALQQYVEQFNGKYLFETGDDLTLQKIFATPEKENLLTFFRGYDLVVIDEAQRIRNIGLGLKIIVDHIPGIRVIASGSSSFDLANKLGEPLTGRQNVITMYPISAMELAENYGKLHIEQNLENLMVYGNYPETLTTQGLDNKQDYLSTLVNSYLYKDILELENLRSSDKIQDLLRLIAFQVGKEVSTSELSNTLDISRPTVEKYLQLLQKAFVLIKVRGFSRNLRKEVSKSPRFYFYDNGILNEIIKNYNPISIREDIGRLWENFLFMERYKKREYQKIRTNYYFWRTYQQKEIDLVEEHSGKLSGYEFKWGNKKPSPPKDWINTYNNASYTLINRDNYLDFIL